MVNLERWRHRQRANKNGRNENIDGWYNDKEVRVETTSIPNIKTVSIILLQNSSHYNIRRVQHHAITKITDQTLKLNGWRPCEV